jgi:hypothetical protein
MNANRELEARLRRYRPVGPPDRLRRQILERSRTTRGARRWWLAAAAVLLVTAGVTLNLLTARIDRRIDRAVADAQSAGVPLASSPEGREVAP